MVFAPLEEETTKPKGGEKMDMEDLKQRKVLLQAENNRLMTTIVEANYIMQRVGFSEGLKTVKEAAQELYDQNNEPE